MSDIGSWFGKQMGASQSRDQQTSANKPRRRRSGIMLLEPRMMYDGAGAATAAHHHHHHDAGADPAGHTAIGAGAASESNTATGTQSPASGSGSGNDQHAHSGTNSSEPRAHVVTWVKDPTEIVFIDAQVPDAQVLAQGAKPGVEVVMLDANGDGVKQIADFLARHPDPNLTTIDIVAHGADGMIQLGNTILSSSNVGYYESQLAAIGNAMQPGGTIQIFGCDVAKDMTGDIFLAQLSAATGGKNIDASSHLVGAAALGGSWMLDVELSGGSGGMTAATRPFTDAALASYADVLPDWIFVTSTSPAGPEVTLDNTGTANNNASLTVTGSGTLIDPTYIAVDAAHGVFYVVDFENAGSTASEQAIYVGAISGTLADGHKVDKIFSTPAADLNLFGGVALDATTNTLYFAQGALNEYDPSHPSAHTLDQINGIFSLNLNNLNLSNPAGPGILSETLVAYGPNLGVFMDIAVDPVNHKIYFIDDSTGSDQSTFAGNPNASATNDIYVANIGSSPSLATSILHLASSDAHNGANPIGYTQGFLSGLALDVTNQVLYFSTWDQNYTISTGAAGTDNVYKASVSALGTTITGANVSSALLYSTAAVGQPSELKVDVSSGQLFILNRNTTSSASGSEQGSVLVGSVNGGAITKIFQPAQSTTGNAVITNLALDAAPALTGSGATTTYTEGSSADHFESNAGITTLSDPGELLAGATVQIGTGFDAGHDILNFASQNGISGSYNSGTGVLTLSGVASAAAYATAIDSVTFRTDSGSATQRAISFTVTDGVATSNSVTDHINVNVPPTFGSVGNTVQFYQSTGTPLLLDSAITVTDASGANITSAVVTVGNTVSGDTLTINGATSGTIAGTNINYTFSGSTLDLVGSDTAAHYAAALAAVSYSFTGDPTNGGINHARTVSWVVTDAHGLSSAAGAKTTLDVYATPVVVIGTNSPTPTVTSSSGPVFADPGLSITDNNGTSFSASATNATVKITGGFQAGDTLSDNGVSGGGLVPGTTIHATYDSSTQTLTLSGADTVADYIAALEQVQFNVAGTNAGTRTLTWQINDEAGGNTNNSVAVTSTVNAAFVNQAPTATVPGTDYSATEQVNLTLKGTGLSVGDVDGGSGIETVTLSVVEGGLTADAGNSGISIFSGNGTSSLVITGTIAQLNAFLAAGGTSTLVYNDNTDTPGASTTLTLAIDDGGNTGTGGAHTASASVTIDIAAVNDAPVASVPAGPYSAIEQTTLDLKNTGLSVNDVDSLGGIETATLSVTEGTLTVTAGTSGATVSNSGTSSVTITGTLAQINALLATDGTSAVSYIDNTDNPSASATLTLAINDNGNTGGAAQTGNASVAINITAVNDAPTVSVPGTHYSATEQVDLSLKGTGLSVGDVDGGSGIETVTLSVGEGILTADVGNSGISIVSGNSTSSLQISGTIAQLNAFLGAGGTSTLVYNDNTNTPSANTTLTLAINDGGNTGGGALTASAPITIDIAAVNDAPVASVPAGPYSAIEQTTLDLKNTGLSVNDVDSLGGIETATLSVTEGTLTVTAGNSGATVSNSGTSSVTITGTTAQIDALLNTDASSAVSYIDNTDNPSASATLTLAINDNGNTGAAAQTGNASVAINITAVNDAPTVTVPGTHYSATEQVDLSLKGTGLAVGDVDGGSGIETVTLSVGEGILTADVGNSGISIVSGNSTSSLQISGTIAQLNAFLGIGGTSTLVYNDNTNTPSANTTLTLAINDGGNTGGGALTASAPTIIDIAAVNDAPVATVPAGPYSVLEQTGLNLKNTGLSVSDVDGGTGSETVTLSVTEGTLTVAAGTSGAGVSGNGTSSVTITGTTAQIDALLNTDASSAVSYIDNTDNPSASATLTLAINDNGNTGGAAQSASSSVAINITAVNDAPTVSVPGTHYSATEQVDLSLKGTGLSVGDVDGGSGIETVTLSVGEGILTGDAGNSGISIVSGNSTSSLQISGTIAQLNAFLGAGGTSTLVYNDNTDTPSASTTLTLAINDGGNTGGGALTASAPTTIDIAAVNDAPTVKVPGVPYGVLEQTSLDLKNTGMSVNDVDSLGGIETATLSVTEGTLTVTAGTSGASVAGNGTSSVTITGTTAQIDALLNTDASSAVSYIDNTDNPSASATLTLAINDNGHTGGAAQSASSSVAIDITAVNDAPTASAPAAHYGATEQVDLSLKGTGLSVGDVDGGSGIETVTLSVGEGILTADVGNSGISIVSVNSTSSLQISGTIAQLNAFLGIGGTSTLVYNDNTDTPSASTTLTLVINDGGNTGGGALTANASATIDITAVNDAPTASVPGTHYAATEQVDLSLKNTGLSVGDVDGLGGIETATLSVTEGTLTVTAGASGASVSGSGTSSVTISGTTAQIDALLNTDGTSVVSYVDTSHNASPSATLTLAINDNGHTGGAAQSASASATIDITGVNDAPTVSVPGAHYSATEQVDLSLKNTGLSVGDVDGRTGIETVTLSVGEGILTGAAGDSGVSIVSGNGTSSLVVSGSISQLNAFLGAGGTSTLVYNDNTNTPGSNTTLTLAINDNGHTGTGGALSANASATIDIIAVNDAPVVTAGNTIHFDANGSSKVPLDAAITVSDVDSSHLTGARVAITGNFAVGDNLNFVNQFGITGSYNATTGVLTLTGTDTVAHYQLALASISFSSNTQKNDSKTVTWTVTDLDETTPSHTTSPLDATSATSTTSIDVRGRFVPPPFRGDDHHHDDGGHGDDGHGYGYGGYFGMVTSVTGGGFFFTPASAIYVSHAEIHAALGADDSLDLQVPLLALASALDGDVVAIDARLADGSPLPKWLHFDGATGKLAGLPPNDVSTASISPDDGTGNGSPTKAGTGGPAYKPGDTKLTIEIVGWSSKGDMSILTVTIDLGAGSNGTGNDQPGSSKPQQHGWLGPRDAGHRLGGFEPRQAHLTAASHHDGASIAPALPAGRAGLTAQLDGAGWRAMHADRMALLQSVRDSANRWQ